MTDAQNTHETFHDSDDVKVGSERSFGIVFAVVFAIIGLLPLWGCGAARVWALGVGAVFLVAAFAFPAALRPLNLIWFRFGLVLHKIVNPLIMGMVFFLTVTPIALIMRIMGKDPLRRRFDPEAPSYWIVREEGDLPPDSMRRQF